MSGSGLPTSEPVVSLETEPFWAAADEGRLVLPRCDACDTVIWYPRRFCPVCHTSAVSWFDASGRGTVYSFTIVRKGQGKWADVAPYVIAYVELDEGPRVLTNIVGTDPAEVRIGLPVVADFATSERDDGEAFAVPRFRPA